MGQVNDELIQEVYEIAANVSRQVHKRYTVYFDAADVRQELVMWAMKKSQKVEEWLNPEQEPADRKAGIRQLAKAMQREADKYCRARKAKASGYEVRDEYFYSTGLVEELIANLNEMENRGSRQPRVSGGGGDPATAGNYLASVIDIRSAMEKLDPQDQLMLEMRYQEGQTYSQIAQALELSDTTVHRRVNSALKRIVRHLGGESPYSHGMRRVVSNGEAQAILSSYN